MFDKKLSSQGKVPVHKFSAYKETVRGIQGRCQMKTPHVLPRGPNELPRQHLYEVVDIPEQPAVRLIELLDYERSHSFDGIPQKPTQKSVNLCQVEWAWSPMHNVWMPIVCTKVAHTGCYGWVITMIKSGWTGIGNGIRQRLCH